MASKNYFPTKSSKGQGWGSGVREAWPQCRRRPPGLHKCKKSPFSLAAWAEFHKGPLCGACTPPPPSTHTHSLTNTHTYTHTSSKRHAYTGHRQWGVSGQQSHIHVNLKYFPSLEQERSPRSACSNAFCLQFTQEWTTNSFFFLCLIYRALFKFYMVLQCDGG